MREVVAYVLSKDGRPLMPMYSHGRVRRLRKEGKAVVKSRVPYVIQLTYDLPDETTQPIIVGIDPGRTNIGVCAVNEKGEPLYTATIETRNKEIPDLMSARAANRRASRSGERKRRQRRAISKHTCFPCAETKERILPQCEEPVTVHYINNTEAKFCNRKRPKGWLTPTANQLLQTHKSVIELVKKILPVTTVVLEINKFDFVKMENLGVKNWEYQKGKLWGFDSVEAAIAERQGCHCIFCKKKIEHYHHVEPKHLGGSESVDNRAGLCEKHHAWVHTDAKWEEKLKAKQQGMLKKYHALSVINQIMPYLIGSLANTEKDFCVTTGYDTHVLRKAFDLPKLHYADAWCIAVSATDCFEEPKFRPYKIKQFRRQNRAIINNQRERTYKLYGVVVAKNRKKRFEQKSDSLYEWYQKQIIKLGDKKARLLLDKLDVAKSTRYYNTSNRVMPGTAFLYKGKRHVVSGQLTNGQYYRAVGDESKMNYPARDCKIISANTGLVYI